jgi:hypothetical protein
MQAALGQLPANSMRLIGPAWLITPHLRCVVPIEGGPGGTGPFRACLGPLSFDLSRGRTASPPPTRREAA